MGVLEFGGVTQSRGPAEASIHSIAFGRLGTELGIEHAFYEMNEHGGTMGRTCQCGLKGVGVSGDFLLTRAGSLVTPFGYPNCFFLY